MSIPDLPPRRYQQGLTFIELVMFIVIVSVAVAGILLILNFATSRSADPQRLKQAQAIAEALMEEVQGSRFTFCDPSDATAETATSATVGAGACTTTVENVGVDAGEARPFDNVNDYVTAFNTPATISQDVTGQPFPAGYSATITLAPVALNGITSGAAPTAMNVLHIRVAVSYGNDEVVLDGYRTRYQPNWLP